MSPFSKTYMDRSVDFSRYHLALQKGHVIIHFDMMAVTLGHKQVFLGRKSKVWILFWGEFLLQPFGNRNLAVCGCSVPELWLARAAVKG